MKKIGIIGGLGPQSTIDYYRAIIAAFKPTYETSGYPEIAVESMDLRWFTEQTQAGRWDTLAATLIASNTPHRVFDQVQQGTSLPLLSIVEATRDQALQLGVARLCLLGTAFTMQSDFYQRTFQAAGMELFVPNPDEIEYIQEKIFSEIEFGTIKAETKAGFLWIIERIETEQQVEGVILGCTELPMLLRPGDFDLHYIDTTAIHTAAIVESCRME